MSTCIYYDQVDEVVSFSKMAAWRAGKMHAHHCSELHSVPSCGVSGLTSCSNKLIPVGNQALVTAPVSQGWLGAGTVVGLGSGMDRVSLGRHRTRDNSMCI